MATIPPSELRRHKERGLYDIEAISSLFSDCYFAHVAYVDENGSPHCLPMIAVIRTTEEGESAVYLHGHPKAKLMEIVKRNKSEQKTKVCITATKGMFYISYISLVFSQIVSLPNVPK